MNITPLLTLNAIDTWDINNLDIWPNNQVIDIINNTDFLLDLSLIKFNLKLGTNIIESSFKPIKIEVNWGDSTSEYAYSLTNNARETWLYSIQDWYYNIGPHRYNFLTENLGNKFIIVKIYDSSGNLFGFKIGINILSQAFFNLNAELDIKKAVFNGEIASVIFQLNPTNGSVIENFKTPIISVLN